MKLAVHQITFTTNKERFLSAATIITQAKHYQISELNRDSTNNWSVVYRYKPKTGFGGSDYVEIETCSGGQGLSCENIEIMQINFKITE